ncbi:MAG: glycosyltransferase [bacterium]
MESTLNTNKNPKILILSASIGSGHLRAAEAIELAIKGLNPKAIIYNYDILDFTNTAFRKIYTQTYLNLFNKAPHIWGYVYDLFNNQRSSKQKSDRLRILVEKLNLRSLLKILKKETWDLVINTHFLPAEIIASLRYKKKINIPHMIVTTDYETHRLWVTNPCEHYCTATEEGANYLNYWGVPQENISITGIPIHPFFNQHQDRALCLKSHNLTGNKPIILQLAGGFGLGPIETIYKELLKIKIPLEIVVVVGKNESIKKKLDKIKEHPYHYTKIIGFTDKMHELMSIATIIVSKPGGLTITESLANGIPIAIVNPVPGNESRNCDFLLENGAAIKINNIVTLHCKLTKLLENKNKMNELKKNALTLAKPYAAFEIAQIALKIAHGQS